LRIVGVVEDTLEDDLTVPMVPEVFTPYTGKFRPHGDSFAVVVRSSADPEQTLAALQGAVRELDASLPVYEADVLRTLTERSYWQTRALGLALSCFALASVVLAAIGLFGVTSYNVAERSSEIAIRRALGASRAAIARMILCDTLRVVGFGLALGLSGGWAARGLLASFVYGVTSADPLTYVGVCVGVSLLATLAALAGARAAMSIDPSRTLARA
jgi:predicted lysophospholipase L1 biosynthesis ABC-type transport system permease subunit